jgi:AcrR family transcriptional regulator
VAYTRSTMTGRPETEQPADGSPPPRQTRREQRDATRRRLLDAAAKEFVRHGFANAQIERIVESVGMTRGAFYGHFRSLADIALELLEDDLERNEANLARLVADVESGGDLFELLERRATVDRPRAALGVVFIGDLLLTAGRDHAMRDRMADLYHRRIATLSHVIESVAAHHRVDLTDSPGRLAHILMALELGLALPASILDADQDADVPRYVDAVLTSFFLRAATKPR